MHFLVPRHSSLQFYLLLHSVQFSSVAQSCPTLCNPMNCSMPGLPVHHQFPEFTQTHVHWVGDAIQPSHPLSSPSPPAPNPSQHQSLSNESTLLMRWPKYWSFSLSIIPSKEHPGLISFRMDWLDLLAVHGTLKSLLQHHSSKASILRHSAFFTFTASLNVHKRSCWTTHCMHYTSRLILKNSTYFAPPQPQSLQQLSYFSQTMSAPWPTIKAFHILTQFTLLPSVQQILIKYLQKE